MTEFNEWVDEKEASINSYLFRKHFSFQRPSDMLKALCTTSDRKKNIDLVNMIKRGLSDLINEIKNMSEEEKEIEKLNEIVDIVKKKIKFNDLTQRGEGLKILTPNQMLSRLPTALAQLKVGNNSKIL